MYSDISFFTTRCSIRPQCYSARSDCFSVSPITITNAHNLEINFLQIWMHTDIGCKGSQRIYRLCKHIYCATVMQAHVLEVAFCQHIAQTDYGRETLLQSIFSGRKAEALYSLWRAIVSHL